MTTATEVPPQEMVKILQAELDRLREILTDDMNEWEYVYGNFTGLKGETAAERRAYLQRELMRSRLNTMQV